MFAQERLRAIRDIVRKRRRMNFDELQRLVSVSPATLRRDLTELERAGDIVRVHGGVMDPGYVRSEISFDERLRRRGAAKKAIALAAVRMVPSGVSVLIDAGSTCLEAGKALLGRKDVRLITHSIALLQAGLHGNAELLCIGGELRKVSGALVGAPALGSLAGIRADIAFIGASGLDPDHGCSTTELFEAEMKKAFLACATRKVLLADLSKWSQSSTIRFAEWSAFDDWITDQLPPPSQRKQLRAGGVTIHRAAG